MVHISRYNFLNFCLASFHLNFHGSLIDFPVQPMISLPSGQTLLTLLLLLSSRLVNFLTIDHFTVSCLVAWPLNESEAGGDLVLIETSVLFSC